MDWQAYCKNLEQKTGLEIRRIALLFPPKGIFAYEEAHGGCNRVQLELSDGHETLDLSLDYSWTEYGAFEHEQDLEYDSVTNQALLALAQFLIRDLTHLDLELTKEECITADSYEEFILWRWEGGYEAEG